jgi:hypothetical protein
MTEKLKSIDDLSDPRIRKAMDTLLNIFKNDNLDVVAKAVFEPPKGAVTYAKPSDKWSFNNKLIMFASGTSDARGYNQWGEVGRNVKKGVHAIYILAPLKKKGHKKVVEVDKETGKETEKIISYDFIYGFRGIPVFRYEDTEGKPLPQLTEQEKINWSIPYQYEDIVNDLGIKITPEYFRGDAYGSFNPWQKTIQVMTPDIKTFLHEISHAVDHHYITPGGLKGGQHKDQEVTAEFSAATIAHLMGFKVSLGDSKRYIEHYSFSELLKQLNRVEKVVTYIIQHTKCKEDDVRCIEGKTTSKNIKPSTKSDNIIEIEMMGEKAFITQLLDYDLKI